MPLYHAGFSGERSCDVVIIGAGLSGLVAATLLAQQGLHVIVLEARKRVGGRLLTVFPIPSMPDVFIDHGGQWVSPGQDDLMALATSLNVRLFTTPVVGSLKIDLHDGSISTYTGLYPAYWTDADKAAAMAGLNALEAMYDTVPEDAPWTAPNAQQWDRETLVSSKTLSRRSSPVASCCRRDWRLQIVSPTSNKVATATKWRYLPAAGVGAAEIANSPLFRHEMNIGG